MNLHIHSYDIISTSKASTSHCDVTTSTGTYSCLRLKLNFYCHEGTKMQACYDDNGALIVPKEIPVEEDSGIEDDEDYGLAALFGEE